MELNYLIDFAKTLERNSFVYAETENRKEADAFWIGNEELIFIVKFEEEWWSLSCNDNDNQEVSFNKIKNAENIISAPENIPLQKHPIKSYPDIDYLFYFGDKKITDWLTENNWKKDWGFNGNFKDPIAQKYVNWWIENNVFYSNQNYYAIENGWSMIWPDDDKPLQLDDNNEFLFCTLYDSEPWYEVYRHKSTNKYACYLRVT